MAINDIALLAKRDGADVTNVPQKPMTFNSIVTELERLKVLIPSELDPSSVSPKPSSETSKVEASLSSAFHKEARTIFFL